MLGEGELGEEVLEAGVGAEGFPAGVDTETDQLETAVLEGFGEPLETFVGLIEGEVHRRQLEGRYIATGGELVEVVEHAKGFGPFSG